MSSQPMSHFFSFSFHTPFGRGVHAPASNLEVGSELPTCIASPNTQTCLLTVTKDCISPEQSAVRLLVHLNKTFLKLEFTDNPRQIPRQIIVFLNSFLSMKADESADCAAR